MQIRNSLLKIQHFKGMCVCVCVSHRMSWWDLLDYKLSKGRDALIWAILAEPLADKAFKA